MSLNDRKGKLQKQTGTFRGFVLQLWIFSGNMKYDQPGDNNEMLEIEAA